MLEHPQIWFISIVVLSKYLVRIMCSFFTAVGYLLLTSFGVFCSCRIGMERQLCLVRVEVDMLKQPGYC